MRCEKRSWPGPIPWSSRWGPMCSPMRPASWIGGGFNRWRTSCTASVPPGGRSFSSVPGPSGRASASWASAHAPHGVHTAQILLTAGDFDNRVRYLNARNTIRTLFEYSVLPIINENDTVSVAEIKFGDNDHLAAMVTNLLRAPLLVLLTNVDGLYSGDPRTDPEAKLLDTVPHIDASITGMAGASNSDLGTGGMTSKLKAARLAKAAGEAVIMANGGVDGILDRIFAAEPVGTLFLPHGDDVPAWKRWVGFTARPKGTLTIDAG